MATQELTGASVRADHTAATVHPFPALRPGFHLAPAAIGRSSEAPQVVYVQCPDWCRTDHLCERQVAVEDIVHVSSAADLTVRSFLDRRIVLDLYASVKSEASAHDPRLHAAHVVLDDGSNDAFLTPDMADEVANDLISFASEIRALARTARLHNQAEEVAA